MEDTGKTTAQATGIWRFLPFDAEAETDTLTPKTIFFVSLFAIIACLLWSTAFAGIKIGLRYSEPLSFAGVRFMLAGIMLVPFWWRSDILSEELFPNMGTFARVGFYQTFVLYGLLYMGMTMVPGALGAIVVGSSPLLSAIAAHIYMPGDKLNFKKLVSILVGIFGIALISIARKPVSGGTNEILGIILLLIACSSSAFSNIIIAKDKEGIDPVLFNSIQIFLGGFLLFIISLPIEGFPVLIISAEYYYALFWLSFISAFSFSLWFILLKVPGIKISELNLWKFIIPVGGALISWIVLPDESPSLVPIVGMLFVGASIILYNFASKSQEKAKK